MNFSWSGDLTSAALILYNWPISSGLFSYFMPLLLMICHMIVSFVSRVGGGHSSTLTLQRLLVVGQIIGGYSAVNSHKDDCFFISVVSACFWAPSGLLLIVLYPSFMVSLTLAVIVAAKHTNTHTLLLLFHWLAISHMTNVSADKF